MTGYKIPFVYPCRNIFNIVMTVAIAYPLSRKDFIGRNVITGIFVFTMIFNAPLIPTYLNIKNLGLLDTFWVMVIPGAISVYNMIIARTFSKTLFQQSCLKHQNWTGQVICRY